ncbi:MAG: outer membrane protein assembly factor BamB, partial [Pseudomonadota bacterium]|nr:outer membrane protein assembly factor BamB [Pseudomonadota bacterium]
MKNKVKLSALLAATLLAGCASDREVERVSPLPVFTPSLQIQRVWSAGTGHGTDGKYLRQNPHIAHGKVYTTSYTGEVAATDAVCGRKVWQTSVRDHITSGAGAGNGVVAVGTLGGTVYAFSEERGALLWQMPVQSEILATPVIADNKVLIKTDSGDLQALDASTGRRLWNHHHTPPELTLRGGSSPVVVGNQVIDGLSDGQLVSLNLNDGRVRWSQQIAVPHGASIIERLVDIDGEPVVRDGVIYVVTYQGKLAAVDLHSGHIKWQRDFSSYV